MTNMIQVSGTETCNEAIKLTSKLFLTVVIKHSEKRTTLFYYIHMKHTCECCKHYSSF